MQILKVAKAPIALGRSICSKSLCGGISPNTSQMMAGKQVAILQRRQGNEAGGKGQSAYPPTVWALRLEGRLKNQPQCSFSGRDCAAGPRLSAEEECKQ